MGPRAGRLTAADSGAVYILGTKPTRHIRTHRPRCLVDLRHARLRAPGPPPPLGLWALVRVRAPRRELVDPFRRLPPHLRRCERLGRERVAKEGRASSALPF